jgi:hypothetical protein
MATVSKILELLDELLATSHGDTAVLKVALVRRAYLREEQAKVTAEELPPIDSPVVKGKKRDNTKKPADDGNMIIAHAMQYRMEAAVSTQCPSCDAPAGEYCRRFKVRGQAHDVRKPFRKTQTHQARKDLFKDRMATREIIMNE